MSKEALDEVLRKASTDSAFRVRLNSEFDAAVRPYELTDAEKQQLRVGSLDPSIASHGVPERRAAHAEATHVDAEQALAANQEADQALAAHVDASEVDLLNLDE